MTLPAGSRFGPYEILAALGAGGMGEVYRATDTRLKRQVAFKVLPAALTTDRDRLARFQREAEVLASLNHPNIAALYGLEESGGVRALVMELVEGPTLEDRIAAGPIALDEALPIARQIAQALEAAHQQGIIHRDLKPANVKTRTDGVVKVLDFGLAKALEPIDIAEGGSQSTTITSPAHGRQGSGGQTMTKAGVILGTVAYMSPEQARGRTLDERTDIWAFGCVLFEMLAGEQPFGSDDASTTLANILRADPDWNALPPDTPASIRRLLRRCLTKDPKDRFADVAIARIEIDDAQTAPDANTAAAAGGSRRARVVLFSAFAFVALIALIVWTWEFRAAPSPPEMRVEIGAPPTSDPLSLAIAPDGRKLVIAALEDGQRKLWLRPLNSTAMQPLAGTDGAAFPFWSPDSRRIGFFAEGKLKQIDIAGGRPQILASAPTGRGGAWSTSGEIVFAPTSFPGPLYRVSAAGGEAVALTPTRGSQPLIQRFPQFLPDGRHFLFYAPSPNPENRAVYVGSLDSLEPRRVLDADAAAVFLAPEYIVFMRQRKLFAQRFDLAKLQTEGDPHLLAEEVASDPTTFKGAVSASAGIVGYRAPTAAGPRQLKWFDRSGKLIETVGDPDLGQPLNPELSPDGLRLALDRTVGDNRDVWILDLKRGLRTRFTSEAAADVLPIWAPDGSRIVFGSFRGQPQPIQQLYGKTSDGAGPERVLVESNQVKMPTDWSRDGRFVLFTSVDPKTSYDVWAMPLTGDRKAFPVVSSSFEERDGQLSPDSHWVAYSSNESGRFDVYVQPFPSLGGKSLVSPNGGAQPRWRKDGKELFYVALDGQLMAVPITLSASGQRVDVGRASGLFTVRLAGDGSSNKQQYVVSPDGQRFLMNVTAEEQSTALITLILHWKPL
jgi:eukaryotic-like serine/threonine-protein kinase